MATYYLGDNGKLLNSPTNKNKKKNKKKKSTTYYLGADGKLITAGSVSSTKPTTSKKKEDEGNWFKKGAFGDGKGNVVTDTLLTGASTIGDVGVGLSKGVLNLAEGVTDLAQYGVAGVTSLFDKEKAEKIKQGAKESVTDKILGGLEKKVDQYSLLGDKADSIVEGLGYVGGIMATGGLGTMARLGTTGVTALTTGTTFLSSMGSGMGEAYSSGASDEDAVTYGAIKGVGDAVTELIFGGLGKAVGSVGLSKGISSLDDVFAKKLASKVNSQVAKNFVEFGVKAGAEGTEEVLAGVVSAVGKKVSYMKDEELADIVKDEQLLDQFIAGAITSGFAQSGLVPKMKQGSLIEANKRGTDFVTGYTQNEQKVLDRLEAKLVEEAEQGGKKLSNKDKTKIQEEAKQMLEEGGIDIDFIEETLGEGTYKKYKSIEDREVSLTEQIEEMKNEPNTVGNAEKYEILKKKLDELKNNSNKTQIREQLSQEVNEMTLNDARLRESYNERERRKQSFQADLTKYDSKQAEVIKKAVDNGILNNTRKTHKFVDFVAKISADKGVSFDFTNNERLKESGFAVEGKTVNGFKQGNNITVNINSKNALNSVVGHEVTHVLEGDAELYNALADSVKAFGDAKGVYQEMYDTAFENYKNVYKDMTEEQYAEAIKKEVTADLIGEYIFSDIDFVRSLSTKNRNVFQKVYDEIKYMLKKATAGSDAEKQLLKAKKNFEDAYRDANKNTSKEIVYSMYVDENIRQKAEQFKREGYKKFERVKVVDVTERMANEVSRLVGFDATGYEVYSNTDTYKHIEKRHGENGQQDQTMKDMRDVALMKYVLEEFDEATLVLNSKGEADVTNAFIGKDGQPSKMIKFSKEINGIQHVVVATPENKYKKLWVVSEYIEQKNKDTSQSSHGDVALPPTPQANSDNVSSTNSIPQKKENTTNVEKKTQNNDSDNGIKVMDDGSVKYSISTKDTDGNDLSIEQQEYFKDSKVRDENGNLKVMYRGTANDFTVFNPMLQGGKNGVQEGYGIYFTDTKGVTESYGDKTLEGYLNVKNPASSDKKTIKRNELIKLIKATTEVEAQKFVDDGDYDNIEDALKDTWVSNYVYTYDMPMSQAYREVADQIIDSSDSDMNIIQEVMGGLAVRNYEQAYEFYDVLKNTMGIDGFITEWNTSDGDIQIVVAFDSNQFKNADNTKPTENPDIRYSLSNKKQVDTPIGNYNVYGRDIALEQAPIDNHVVEVNKMMQDVAPVPQEYEAIRQKPEKTEQRMARVKDAPTKVKGSEPSQVAKVLTEEPKVEKKKSRFLSQAMELVADKGVVFENLAKKTKNRELEAKWNSTRYAEGMAQDFIGNGEGNVRALNDVQKEIEKAGLKQELSEYLYHLHNIDRMNLADRYEGMENKPVFGDSVTSDVSRAEVAKLEAKNPVLKKYANEIYSINNHLRKMLVDGGVISQETADLWSEMYPHYVPIRRVGEHGFDINVPLDTRKTGINAPVKRAIGGSSDIMPLFDTMAQRTLQTYRAVARNKFGIELKNTLGTVVGTEATDIDGVMEGMGNQDELLQKGKNGMKPTFTVFEGGEKVTFEIDETMYDALKPTSEALTYTNPVTNAISNFHRNVLTQYNPVFTMRNIIKDTQDVLMNSQHPMKTYANYPKALAELTSKGKWYKEYIKNGGEQNTYFDKKSNTFVKDKSAFVKAIGMPLNAVTKANDFIERLPRLAEYIASRESGRSVEVSMLDSARVTTNFSAGGDLTKFLNRNGATFLNASVQGAMQQVRNIREAKMNGLKGWVQLATKGAIASIPIYLLNSMLWDDDEEYEELSDYVKQNYYVVAKFGDGNFVRIPKGRTLSVIQNAFEQTMNGLTGDDEVDLNSFTQLVLTNLAPNNPFEDNILAPIVQVMNNETWYGEDLVPTRLQDLPNEEQYDESTDDLSRWLGEKTGQSPYKINYLLEQYSGAVGDVFLPMITPEAESGDDSTQGQLIAPLRDAFTTDSVLNNQNVSDFYDTKDELTKVANSSGATDEEILSNKYINSVNSELGKLYGEKREIQNSNLSNSEKYNRVREIQKEINALAKESLSIYPNVQINGDYATVGDRQYIFKDGAWAKLNDEQVKKQDEVTSSLDIAPSEYWSNKEEYDFAFKDEGKYSIANAIGGYDVYEAHKDALNEIRADKDSNGKTINGSAKEKKANYINSLDLDYGQKIILYRSLYDSKADKEAYNNDIVDYLNSRDDISYEDMVAILEELDFKVYEDGTVEW